MKLAAADLGNAVFQTVVEGSEYHLPNVLATYEGVGVSYFEPENFNLFENMVVEIDSASLQVNKQTYFVGVSAATKTNQLPTTKNNQKASEDRTLILLLTSLAYHYAKDKFAVETLNVDLDYLATALPTRQVRKSREELKQKLTGNHTVKFKYVPLKDSEGTGDITVRLNIKETIVGVEGNLAFLALTRDSETLKTKDASLLKETILIADLGGDSYDPAGFENGKLIDDSTIAGEAFGINEYLDAIIRDVMDETGYRFPSRYNLEQLLIKGASEWYITVNQEDINIEKYIEPHLKLMVRKYLNLIDQTRKNVRLQNVKRIYPVGGTVEVAKKYIKEINDETTKLRLEMDVPNVNKLNLEGLWILVRATAEKAKRVGAENEQKAETTQ